MNKQLSVDLLRKQLAQTDGLTEAQLNSLLERLESQKARLPQEDRSIIDWGIGFVKAKRQEELQLMETMLVDFISKYADYNTFKQGTYFREKSNWINFQISNTEGQHQLYDSFICRLKEFIIDTSNLDLGGNNGKYYLTQYLPTVKRHLSDFTNDAKLDAWIFNNCVKEFNNAKYQSMKHPEYYKLLASELPLLK